MRASSIGDTSENKYIVRRRTKNGDDKVLTYAVCLENLYFCSV
jgi:hypothetical protein